MSPTPTSLASLQSWGLYASILPLVAYALFGTSRQLVIGPDTATCAMVAVALTPLAGGDPALYQSLSVVLALIAGLFCIAGRFLRLGALADLLSRPILIGFLHGIALSILLGQLGKIFGFPIDAKGIVPPLIEFASKLGLTHWPTLTVGVGSFAVLLLSARFLTRLPAALVTVIVAALAVKLLGLDAQGVKTVGVVPAGLPPIRLPEIPPGSVPRLLANAAGLALVSFSSMMITARSFAAKNRYDVDVDREFAALGASNIAAALSQEFAVSGADSRTAMSDASGGRTQVTGLVAAAAVGAVLLFFTGPLRFVPIRFVQLMSRLVVELLGEVPGLPGLHSLARHADAASPRGLVLFRFNGPIVFFNAPFWKREVLAAADRAGSGLRWFVLDLGPVTFVDATGLATARDVFQTLRERGVVVATAGRQTEWRNWWQERGFTTAAFLTFPTLRQAVRAYRDEQDPAASKPSVTHSPV